MYEKIQKNVMDLLQSHCNTEGRGQRVLDLVDVVRNADSVDKKHAYIVYIDEIFQRKKSKNYQDTNANKAITRLKNEIIEVVDGEYNNWKDALWRASYQPISHIFKSTQYQTKQDKRVCTINGKTNSNDNQKNKPATNVDTHGSYVASTVDGYVVASAKGWVRSESIDWRYNNEEKNAEEESRGAYFAAKSACRLMAGYQSDVGFAAELKKLAERVAHEIPVKTRAHRDLPLKHRDGDVYDYLPRTTLLCYRVFCTPAGLRVIGFNMGDSMLVAYDPSTQKFKTIAKAKNANLGLGIMGVPHLPTCNNYYGHVDTFDELLPENCILLNLTAEHIKLPLLINGESESIFATTRAEINFDALMQDKSFQLPQIVNAHTLATELANYATHHLKGNFMIIGLDPSDAHKSNEDRVADMPVNNEVKIDNIPYSPSEIAASILTLGLYALIRDCLHFWDDEEITTGDVAVTVFATFGFFSTASLVGIGYLIYKGIVAINSDQEQASTPTI